ncbi:oligopeptide transporter subunit; ATP-binding component of ABC superfamily [uncultured spirochete]|uniref:Oligopeptide transporter subunit ATP-binding component of ABC superfamily n=1 Tax=uncultured spirochete TaxID=156406 RepID=A0A3P3XPX7_9SPIR|nr:oligopeptide transporter subunit; ATP-binding component of ABC superfamily [uncultured spirochete]
MQYRRGDLLDVSNLRVVFDTYAGQVKALNGVELWMNHGERLGVVGETGCGKSVTALSVMRLIEEPGRITEGSILFEDKDLATLSENILNTVRGKDIAMIFQEPVAALNPVMKVGAQIVENIECQRKSAVLAQGARKAGPVTDSGLSQKHRTKETGSVEIMRDMLGRVGLDWQRTENLYPHELSGGMAQRVMIAMALSSKPKLLIADEPTSALDVTIQAQILNLLNNLVRETQTAVLLITHAMGVAAQFCDFIAVMYAGNVVEYGSVQSIFKNPLHPYTKGLLRAVPKIGRTDELQSIPGIVPDLISPPSGCRFHPRCPHRRPECDKNQPRFEPVREELEADRHHVACFLYQKDL